MNELLLPQHTNALGTAFGGVIMSWIDICAALASQRHARCTVVTVSMDTLTFLAPIRAGELVNLRACVNHVWRSSMEVGVRVEAEDTIAGARRHAASAFLTFVALDEDGRPCPIRPLNLESEEARARSAAAQSRRALRLQSRCQ